ncbi:heme oxygenase (biliverdin-producing) [Corynebacterium sp. L4756]|uniref:biliverdin-producing heme oxygenase n=1 Tax=unclassified Corynebacterium TaxID=2624378 RepID=UPI00374CE8E1
MTVTTSEPLSLALRAATATAHENAETSDFMEELLGGKLDAAAVAEFTGQLWFVYEALERAVRGIEEHPLAAAIVDRRLERQAALEADLAGMYGSNWRDEVRILPATMRYVARLEELTGTGDPVPVIAHHYVRYLGDVSGGQVIAARLGTYYDIDSESLNFYDFTAIGKIPPYRNSYRAALDELQIDDEQRSALLAEAQAAFGFNSGVFADLGKRHGTKS